MESGIGESGRIKAGGSYERQGYQVFSSARPNEKKPVKFRKGEILQGTILSIISETEVQIKIPTGNFTAILKGSLKAGDSLYFMVQETEPALLLRIYALPMSNTATEIPVDDIIRILNLPETEFFKSLVKYYRSRKGILFRDKFLAIHLASLKLEEKDIGTMSLEDIIRIWYDISESGIEPTVEVFNASKYLWDDIIEIDRSFSSFTRLLPGGEAKELFARLSELISRNYQNSRFVLKMMTALLLDDSENIIRMLTESAKKQNPGGELLSAINKVEQYHESLMNWNIIAAAKSAQEYALYPLMMDGVIVIGRIGFFKEQGINSVRHKQGNPNPSSSLVYSIIEKMDLKGYSDEESRKQRLYEQLQPLAEALNFRGYRMSHASIPTSSAELMQFSDRLATNSAVSLSIVV